MHGDMVYKGQVIGVANGAYLFKMLSKWMKDEFGAFAVTTFGTEAPDTIGSIGNQTGCF